jgi:NADPH-dependent curcumin reductase CurA
MKEGKSYVEPFELNAPMEGGCIGQVVSSSHPKFSEGEFVLGMKGWRNAWTSRGEGVIKIDPSVAPVQSFLGVLGLTGMTAFVGLLEIGKLKEGNCVFVSAAAGAVGSIACQIAKLKNCRVVGSAGSAEKIAWLKRDAGVDEAFNYRETPDIAATLSELCPGGIDVYFDNVGGNHLEAAIDNMNDFGRIVACGMISSYNDETPQPGPRNLFKIIGKRLTMEGFIVRDHFGMWREFQQEMVAWISGNQIRWEETVADGLENAPQAFINLFHGDNFGKSLVRLS